MKREPIEAPPSSRQRRLGIATLILGILTLSLGGLALNWDSSFTLTVSENFFAAWSRLLFQAAGLLVFDQSLALAPGDLFAWARLSALAFAAMAALTIVLGISDSVSRWTSLRWLGLTSRLRPSRAHAAVVGLGPLAQELIRDITHPASNGSSGRRRVVAARAGGEDDSAVREAQARGALVIPGEARDPEVLDQLRLNRAREVFVTPAGDARALDTAGDLLRFSDTLQRAPSHTEALQCYVHVGDPAYADLFREHPLFQAPGGQVEFHVFNDRELSALHLLLDETQGLATAHAPEEDEVAHYVLVGFGVNGQTIATQAARLVHFSGLDRLRMTVVDDFRDREGRPGPAAPALRTFLARYPAFAPEGLDLLAHARLDDPGKDGWAYRGPGDSYRPACRSARRERPAIEYVVNAEFLDLPAEDPDLAEELCARFRAEGDSPVRPVIVACFDDEGRSFRTALRLKELLSVQVREAAHSDANRGGKALPPIPIFAFLPQEEGLAELIGEEAPSESGPSVTVRAAGMHSRAVGYRQVVRPVLRDLARSIARHYEEIYGPGEVAEDFWETLSLAFKKSNEDAAAHAVVKLRTIGAVYPLFGDNEKAARDRMGVGTLPSSERPAPADPSLLGQMEHNRFVAERLLGEWRHEPYPDGYHDWPDEKKRSYRQQMKARKRRASLCPFEDLPPEDIPKDDEQVVALHGALKGIGVQVPRLVEWIETVHDPIAEPIEGYDLL